MELKQLNWTVCAEICMWGLKCTQTLIHTYTLSSQLDSQKVKLATEWATESVQKRRANNGRIEGDRSSISISSNNCIKCKLDQFNLEGKHLTLNSILLLHTLTESQVLLCSVCVLWLVKSQFSDNKWKNRKHLNETSGCCCCSGCRCSHTASSANNSRRQKDRGE